MCCKQPEFNVPITALYCKQITTVTVHVLFTVLYWRLCCQHNTVNFTVQFLQCTYSFYETDVCRYYGCIINIHFCKQVFNISLFNCFHWLCILSKLF